MRNPDYGKRDTDVARFGRIMIFHLYFAAFGIVIVMLVMGGIIIRLLP